MGEGFTLFPQNLEENGLVTVEVTGLAPLTQYSIYLQYTTEMGNTPKSSSSKPLLTTAYSKPQKVNLANIDFHSLEVSWSRPAVIAEEIADVISYKIRVYDIDGVLSKELITSDQSLLIDGLKNAAEYTISVVGYVENVKISRDNHVVVESLPANFSFHTAPLVPNIAAEEISMESVTLKWSPPEQVAGEIQQFSVDVVEMNKNATTEVEGSEKKVYYSTDDKVYIDNLVPGTLYSFSSKVFTTEGNSDVSTGFILRTKFNQTELDQMRNDINENLNNTIGDIQMRSRFCGYTSKSDGIGDIPFDSIFVEDNNVAGAQMLGAKFTTGAAGIYNVLVSLEMTTGSGEEQSIWVAVNGVRVETSVVHSVYGMYDTGLGTDLASRQLLLHLGVGNSVSLEHEVEGSQSTVTATLCVSSVSFE